MGGRVCQSCGMPLYTDEILGTDSSGIRIEAYCKYCYHLGQFTQQVTMEEMIALCARYVDSTIRPIAVANMRIHFPTLRRWAKREQTQHEYHRSINRVLDYIREHLGEEIKSEKLAGIAAISPFHFHCIFKATIGETLADYVKRTRLEWVALQLQTSETQLAELAAQVGYSSEQALSRAFKNHFGLPPSAFRESFLKILFAPRVCRTAAKTIVMLAGEDNWNKLYVFATMSGLMSDATEHIEIVDGERFIPCLTVKEMRTTGTKLRFETIPEGLYAIFTCRGNPHTYYAEVVPRWLSASKYKQAACNPYLKFIDLQSDQSISEIYLPLEEQKG